jgi:alkylation response protein AidB-like acyl-CoA dehydrogenase
MAKRYATNMAMKATLRRVQVMGSYGYSKEYRKEKYMLEAKIVQIFLGPNELLSQLIANRRFQRMFGESNFMPGLVFE